MPSTRRHSYDLNFKLKIVAEAEAVENNREIAHEYGISESMVRKWRNQQHVLFSGELKMTAKRASMGRYRPKDPEVDQQLADWFSDQRSQGNSCSLKMTLITTLFTLPLQVVYVIGLSMLITDRMHCIYICGSCSKQHHASAKGEGTQLRSSFQGIPWVVHKMETSPCYVHEK